MGRIDQCLVCFKTIKTDSVPAEIQSVSSEKAKQGDDRSILIHGYYGNSAAFDDLRIHHQQKWAQNETARQSNRHILCPKRKYVDPGEVLVFGKKGSKMKGIQYSMNKGAQEKNIGRVLVDK
mmetsp:Transcript_55193/g.145702  ORF Transcript_55193/g.145702 Transcript_55193/m.145702 type:complete len:122 (-) Transcript_55193:232-597(-)